MNTAVGNIQSVTKPKVLFKSIFDALDNAHTDAQVVGYKGIVNSISAQVLQAIRQHIMKQRRIEPPEDAENDIDIRNEHDNWLNGLQFSEELTENSGHMVQEAPLFRASKLLAVREDVINRLKPLIKTQYDAPQTFQNMSEQLLRREAEQFEIQQQLALERAKTDGRNAQAMAAQNVVMLKRQKSRNEELMKEVMTELASLEATEGIDASTDLGVQLNARMWTSALNTIGQQSDGAYLRGSNVTYSAQWRKEQLALSELLTREGCEIYTSYEGWLKDNSTKIDEALAKDVRMPELRQEWTKLRASVEKTKNKQIGE